MTIAETTPIAETTANDEFSKSSIDETEQTSADVTGQASKDGDFVIPEEEKLWKGLEDALIEINVKHVNNLWFDNYEDSDNGVIHADILLETDIRTLRCSCIYISIYEHWQIVLIENDENHHEYYLFSGADVSSDIYDYTTDLIISEKDENYVYTDPLEKYNEDSDKLMESAYDAIESIADKYDIKQ